MLKNIVNEHDDDEAMENVAGIDETNILCKIGIEM